MIAIVDYDAGNIRSVLNAMQRTGAADVVLTADPEMLRKAGKVILPGVGEAATAMRSLQEKGLADVIPTLTCPVLGICIGMHLLCSGSEEGDARCMGIFPQRVVRFQPAPDIKIPHMGWNSLTGLRTPLFRNLPEGSYAYFVHSYYVPEGKDTAATCVHGTAFSAALARDNFYGVQFHPEKSGAIGARILQNFIEL